MSRFDPDMQNAIGIAAFLLVAAVAFACVSFTGCAYGWWACKGLTGMCFR